MFGPENIIFVDDSRYPGAPGRGGPVGRVARVTPKRSSCVRVLDLSDTAVRHPLAPSGASTEVPRRISLGFAHSAAAAGDGRRGGRTQHGSLAKPFVFPANSGRCTLAQQSVENMCIFTIKSACGSATPTASRHQCGGMRMFNRESKPESARGALIYCWA